jgi:uncharacterized protein (DUF1697 family)
MPRYIALLRAINVGGRTVTMDRLRRLFEAMRLRDVETLIASGNVMFDAASTNPDALEQRIERRLARELGFEVATFLRTPAELTAIVAHEPFPSDPVDTSHALSIGFLKSAPAGDAQWRLDALHTTNDDFHLHERALYWRRRRTGLATIASGARLEKSLGPLTLRNVTTVRKLALAEASP